MSAAQVSRHSKKGLKILNTTGVSGKAKKNVPVEAYDDEDLDNIEWVEVKMDKGTTVDDYVKYKAIVRDAFADYVDINQDFDAFINIAYQPDRQVFYQDVPFIMMRQSLDLSDKAREQTVTLIRICLNKGVMTPRHLLMALSKMHYKVADLSLDCPAVSKHIQLYADDAVASGALTQKEVDLLAKTASTDELKQLKAKVKDILKEFYDIKEMATKETSSQLLNVDIPPSQYFELVKIVVVYAMDKGFAECEMASQLLVELTSTTHFVQPEDAARAFSFMLENAEELILDVPKFPGLLASFIARALVDDVLPPSFLARLDLVQSDIGWGIVENAQQILHSDDVDELMEHIWTEKPSSNNN